MSELIIWDDLEPVRSDKDWARYRKWADSIRCTMLPAEIFDPSTGRPVSWAEVDRTGFVWRSPDGRFGGYGSPKRAGSLFDGF